MPHSACSTARKVMTDKASIRIFKGGIQQAGLKSANRFTSDILLITDFIRGGRCRREVELSPSAKVKMSPFGPSMGQSWVPADGIGSDERTRASTCGSAVTRIGRHHVNSDGSLCLGNHCAAGSTAAGALS